MILTHDEIRKEIASGRVVISPLDTRAIGPASIDLSLGDTIRAFKGHDVIDAAEGSDYRDYTEPIKIHHGYLLRPGELVMGITHEKVTLPPDICGWLNSRSRFARLGLMSHITAPFICPGVSNHQVLEIFNAGPAVLRLVPGEKICQLILQRTEGSATYKGKFKEQTLK